MAYLHGAYGEILDSKVNSAQQADAVAVYIGTAPVNLIRDYADKDLVNMPLKIQNMGEVQTKLGYSANWQDFTLCEVFAEHFDNTVGNVGPIYVVNVLDPAVHRDTEKATKTLTFKNNRAEFESSDIILDTFAIADMAEGVDYSLSYNYAKAAVVVQLLKDSTAESISCTYNTVDASAVVPADIIGQQTEDGEYTGLSATALIYTNFNAVLNTLTAPGWSHYPEVYRAHGEHCPEAQRTLGRLRTCGHSSGRRQGRQDRHNRQGPEVGRGSRLQQRAEQSLLAAGEGRQRPGLPPLHRGRCHYAACRPEPQRRAV